MWIRAIYLTLVALLVAAVPSLAAEQTDYRLAIDEAGYANIEISISYQEYVDHMRHGEKRLEDSEGRVLVTTGGDYTLLGVYALVQQVGIEGAAVMVEEGLGGEILKVYCLGYFDCMGEMAKGQ